MMIELIIRSVLLGAGLAMDAFSVSLADGLSEPGMSRRRMLALAGIFAGFQLAMPLIGWVLVRTAVRVFGQLEIFIPWIALLLLLYIGGKMLAEGLREGRNAKTDTPDPGKARETLIDEESSADSNADSSATPVYLAHAVDASDRDDKKLGTGELAVQGIATSIDALSVGFAIEQYSAAEALASSLIIGAVTLAICMGGLAIGKKAGTRLAGRSAVLGGLILIFIGIEIWLRGIL